ncbi:probable receptor-like serine/threonine-protein kinase At4g34500 [Salvia splendens]|uniref:probable receptor-like serine/threonine-protein kinase At4g34500 n=1 Tax=Salvia splendens TaxID=180675 RepID=UPI001103ACA2|nr:probable receptor-like serine/threonine-protein kinase At4g34500 [Salvia splendens]XP_041998173.1 probable receptor-like serine/threonine-protein kinase At4g34500 [Salvia splendens]
MADSDDSAGGSAFTAKTPILHQKLYVVIIVTVLLALAVFILVFIFLRRGSCTRRRTGTKRGAGLIPLVNEPDQRAADEISNIVEKKVFVVENVVKAEQIESESKKASSVSYESSTTRSESSSVKSVSTDGLGSFGWGKCYSLRELQTASNQFSDENVIGEGGYGVVYCGVLHDGSVVAIKKLSNKRGHAEEEFKVEVEAIGKVRHKNLVGLIGYCSEGTERLLVYEYIDNGNLEQWLHGDVGPVSPLTWEVRMKIAVGAARGLAYLHEGLEPKVVHRDVKSSNILLDRKWNTKVSDFGLAKLLESDASHVTTRVMGTFGYVCPDYASTGMLNETNDVYSFGVLLMEIITGRSPVDYSRPPGETNLIDWFKGMIASHRVEELVDPRISVPPPPRALKRVLLLCLRCTDIDAHKRPKMGQVVHMLEADEFSYRAGTRFARDTAPSHHLQATSRNEIPSAQTKVVNDGGERPTGS